MCCSFDIQQEGIFRVAVVLYHSLINRSASHYYEVSLVFMIFHQAIKNVDYPKRVHQSSITTPNTTGVYPFRFKLSLSPTHTQAITACSGYVAFLYTLKATIDKDNHSLHGSVMASNTSYLPKVAALHLLVEINRDNLKEVYCVRICNTFDKRFESKRGILKEMRE